MQKTRVQQAALDLGDEDPLYTRNIDNAPPDRRRVSLRWLAGSVLTGVFSVILVGGALQAAVGVDDYLVVRPALANADFTGEGAELAPKGDLFRAVPESKLTRRVVKISTVTRQDDRDIVRVRPFAHVHTTLAAPIADDVAPRVPTFSAFDIFSEDGEAPPAEAATSDSIYGAEVDGEVSIKVEDFPPAGLAFDEKAELTVGEVEQKVRQAAPFLAEGAVEVSSLPYVDPARFEVDSAAPNALTALTVSQNFSQIEKSGETPDDLGIEDKVVAVVEGASMRKMLLANGATEEQAVQIQSALVANFSFDFRAGQKLRFGLAPDEVGTVRPVRVSLYDDDRHLATVALSDTGTYVAAAEPSVDESFAAAEEEAETTPTPGALPSVFAGLWGTGLSLGMSEDLIESLVRIFAYDVDYQSRLGPTDSLEVIYSAENEAEGAEILYAALSHANATYRFYRFRSGDDNGLDYYDESGKSAKKFLMRKPIAQGRFTSPFGMRRHPILRRYRMHSGVDWAAPPGTHIMAAGNGVIEKIGTRSGYGRSITLKHANGYETTYNHMSGYARGLDAGERVRQGQVIGYVGSTGLSTGPHLHFEVLVNNRFVDPFKIKLPRGRELQGAELVTFEQERKRIDALLVREDQAVAAGN